MKNILLLTALAGVAYLLYKESEKKKKPCKCGCSEKNGEKQKSEVEKALIDANIQKEQIKIRVPDRLGIGFLRSDFNSSEHATVAPAKVKLEI